MTNTLPPSETTPAPEKKITGLRVSKQHAAELNEARELYRARTNVSISISDMVGLLARQYTKGKA
jgi:hypothetical protein